jgi:hypothetical protein
VISNLHRRDDLERHIPTARPLNPSRRPQPHRIRVDQQRDHHRRVTRGSTLPIRPADPIKRAQIHLLNRADHRPHQVILQQPIRQRRRQQHHPAAVARDEVLTHTGIALNPPDGTS